MKRDLIIHLQVWRDSPLRKPLILRGARQVGKSWIVREFGKKFPACVTVNFEKTPKACQFFSGSLEIPMLLERLSLFAGQLIQPGRTLLFLDEIQACEQAMIALRYFK